MIISNFDAKRLSYRTISFTNFIKNAESLCNENKNDSFSEKNCNNYNIGSSIKQRQIFNYIRETSKCMNGDDNGKKYVFIDGPGGSGKSYLLNSIIAYLKKIILLYYLLHGPEYQLIY